MKEFEVSCFRHFMVFYIFHRSHEWWLPYWHLNIWHRFSEMGRFDTHVWETINIEDVWSFSMLLPPHEFHYRVWWVSANQSTVSFVCCVVLALYEGWFSTMRTRWWNSYSLQCIWKMKDFNCLADDSAAEISKLFLHLRGYNCWKAKANLQSATQSIAW